MKQFILAIAATILLGGISFGQVNVKDLLQPSPTFPDSKVVKDFFEGSISEKKKLFCVTISCCSVGGFGVEIYSQTSCHYVYTADKSTKNIVKLDLVSSKELPEYLDVQNDVVLAGLYDFQGNSLILAKGKYKIENGSIYFEANTENTDIAGRRYCWQAVHNYTVLGHNFTVEVNICVNISVSAPKTGAVTMQLNLDQDTRNKLKNSNNIINLKEDILINKDGFNFKIPKGNYSVNDNDQILFNNVKVK